VAIEQSRRSRYSLVSAIAVLLLSMSAAAQTQFSRAETIWPPAPPLGPGTYYLSGERWIAMPHILPKGKRVRLKASSFIPLVGAPKVVLLLNGPTASTEIISSKPIFLFDGGNPAQPPTVGSPQFMMVRLQRNQKSRTVAVTTGATMLDTRKRIPQDAIVPSTITPLGPGTYILTPQIELLPGEYLLTYARGELGGYDFSVGGNPH
jgi:hypothetical protein